MDNLRSQVDDRAEFKLLAEYLRVDTSLSMSDIYRQPESLKTLKFDVANKPSGLEPRTKYKAPPMCVAHVAA